MKQNKICNAVIAFKSLLGSHSRTQLGSFVAGTLIAGIDVICDVIKMRLKIKDERRSRKENS